MESSELSALIGVARGMMPATMWIRGANVLNVFTGEVQPANVAISGDRIAYVGERDPMTDDKTVLIDADGLTLAPGYFEPHAHSCLIYNPQTFAEFSVARGTTAVLQDNMPFFLNLTQDESLAALRHLDRLPVKSYWWCRLDPQMGNSKQMEKFSADRIRGVMNHDRVLQAGELTGWKLLFDLDAQMVENVAISRASGKRIETHNPGASVNTLTVMAAGGATACHESISAADVWARVRLGYHAALRNSSIRPDLAHIVRGLLESGFSAWDRLMFTTDGSSPFFLADGTIDACIKIAIDAGLPPVIAYRMASLNAATYYGLDADLGSIAPGRVADIVFLSTLRDPNPKRVMVNGQIVAEAGVFTGARNPVDWERIGVTQLPTFKAVVQPDWFSVAPLADTGAAPVIELKNAVITQLAETSLPVRDGHIELEGCPGYLYAAVLSRTGEWVSTCVLKGLGELDAIATSHSLTGDFVVVGRDRQQMARALDHILELGGGICLYNDGQLVFDLAMPLFNSMSLEPMDALIERTKAFDAHMRAFGYDFEDPIYSLLFLSATHLPAVRLTARGLVEVKTGRIVQPSRTMDLK